MGVRRPTFAHLNLRLDEGAAGWPPFLLHGREIQNMSRDDLVAMEGKVVEVLVGGNFRVDVEGGHSVLAHLAGRMRRNRIRVVLGDQVTVAVSPYDPSRGLITFRSK